jgi:PAS domain S-box-containing protein
VTRATPIRETFHGFINAVPHAVVVADEAGRILHVNDMAEQLLGYAKGEMAGLAIEQLVPERLRPRHATLRAGLTASHESRLLASGRELVALRKDGTELSVLIGIAPWESPEGRCIVASIVDNEARRHAEEKAAADYRAALELGEFSQAIIREAAIGIIIYEADTGACILANDAAAGITGVPRETLLSQNFRQIASWRASGLLADAERALEERRPVERDVEFVTTAGKDVALSCEFLAISLRHRLHLVMMMDDLTERRDLEQQLRVAQKMEAIGQLAGGVAHDFNNLLTVIGTYSSLLMEEMPEGDSRRDDLAEIFSAATRAATLTRQLLAFGRRQLLDARDVNVNEVVHALEKMLRRVISAEISLEIDLAPDLGTVHADAGQLEQALMNLVVNARDAMPSGGRLRIETRNVDLVLDESERVGLAAQVSPGTAVPMVALRVSDTGVGIDPATRARIFEPFFTTKGPGRGSGLGLSTTYGIVKQSGGVVRVESVVGDGTTFELYFPRMSSPATAAESPAPVVDDAPGSGDVLVVEDDEHVRRIVVSALRERGYAVIEACDGEEALVVAEAMPAAPALLVTDVIMPRMNGRQLADRLRGRWPDLRVLFTSAYAVDESTGQAVADLPGSLLRKPFVPAELGAAVRTALAEHAN